MDSALTRLRALDPRVQIGAAVVVAVLIVGVVVALTSSPQAATAPTATTSPTVEPSATPARVRSTPVGTAAPRPATFVGIAAYGTFLVVMFFVLRTAITREEREAATRPVEEPEPAGVVR